MNGNAKNVKSLGRFIVADPRIRRGRPTIRGTRIMASDVLELVELGMSWNRIADEFRGSVSIEAIAECVRLATKALKTNSEKGIKRKFTYTRAAA